VLGQPARGFCFRDDREDLDSFTRDVIEHPHVPNPEAILRLAQAAEALDPTLARLGRLVPQVLFEGIPHFGPTVGRQRSEGLRRRGLGRLVSHSGQNSQIWSWSNQAAAI
jgi:hypothetical protein